MIASTFVDIVLGCVFQPIRSHQMMQRAFGVFGYSRRAIELVWTTSKPLTIAIAILTLIAGILPAAIAYVGKLIVDGVVILD